MTRYFLTIVFLILALTRASAQQIESPKLSPSPSTDKQAALIKEGVALHDQGDFDGAIRKYEEALAENPANVAALYELGFSYSMKKDYKKSLETAYRGAQYKSEMLGGFYLLAGNNLDQLGDTKKAVEVYKSAIKVLPNNSLIHYNLALAYKHLNKPDEVKKSLKTALLLDPQHPSSHLALAAHYFDNEYRTPALFAAARFLTLEPKTARAAAALKIVQDVLRGGVSAGSKPNEINIFVNMNAKKDEGDFGSLDLMLGLSSAVGHTEKSKGKSEMQLLVEQVDTVLAILSETGAKKDQSTFVFKYYVPYFVELKQKNFVEPFVYYTFQQSNNKEVGDWLSANSGRVMQFLIWSKQYQWPKSI